MQVAIFQHAANEPAGILESIFHGKEVPFEYIRLYDAGEVPPFSATHLLFMGGPMSVNDEREYPFLAEEKPLIRTFVAKGLPVLGICLGAQLIASAMGGRVYRDREEIGWCSVRKVSEGIFSGFPREFKVFQLHGETFEVPDGGTPLCTGDVVRNQAFSCGSALGLQFHLELTRELIDEWVHDLRKDEQAHIRSDTERHLPASNALCRCLAVRFLEGWQASGER